MTKEQFAYYAAGFGNGGILIMLILYFGGCLK